MSGFCVRTKKTLLVLAVTALLPVSVFAAPAEEMTETEAIAALFDQNLDAQKLPEKHKEKTVKERLKDVEKNGMRSDAIRENAFMRGVAEGRLAGFNTQHALMVKLRSDLDRIYNVSNLYLENGTLQPPIILTGDNLFEMQGNGRGYKQVDNRREIVSPARYVTEQLNWETYLISEDDLALPDDYYDVSLKSRTKSEAEEEKKYYRLGLAEGRGQAFEEVKARIERLTAIVGGMRQGYKEMLAGSATAPVTVAGYEPVAGNQTQIETGIRTKNIVQDAGFVLDVNAPRAFVGTHKK